MTMTFWDNQRVLVTGGSGFLGSHLCRRLMEQGAQVHATSRAPKPEPEQDSGIRWWRTDLGDVNAFRDLLDSVKPEVIYHLAGAVGASPARELVLPTFHSLLESTVNLLTAITETGCRRLVLTGSLTEPETGGREATPASPYAAAKWAASGYGRMFHALYQTPAVILRPFMTYGPAQDTRKLIPSIILSLLEGKAPQLSSGQWQADWIFVDDVIDGFLAAAERPGIEGQTLDLGSGALVSVRALVEQLVTIMSPSAQPMFGALPDRPMEPVCVADVIRSESQLGWCASTPLDRGLHRTVEWYRSTLNATNGKGGRG